METALTHPNPHDAITGRITEAIASVMSNPEMAERMSLLAMNEIRRNPALGACSPLSVANAFLRIHALDLDPVLPNEIHLVPYKGECTLQIGYAGLRKLALRHPDVLDIWCETVYQNDRFEEQGIHTPPLHRPPDKFHPRGSAIGYYAVAEMRSGAHRIVRLSVADAKAHGERYSRRSGIWTSHPEAMAFKTCLRMLCHPRHLPMFTDVVAMLSDEDESWQVVEQRPGRPAAELPPPSAASAADAADLLYGEGGGKQIRAAAPKPPASDEQKSIILDSLLSLGVEERHVGDLYGAAVGSSCTSDEADSCIELLFGTNALPNQFLSPYLLMLRAEVGMTPEEIKTYMANRYGEGARAKDLDDAGRNELVAWVANYTPETSVAAVPVSVSVQDVARHITTVVGCSDDVAVGWLDAAYGQIDQISERTLDMILNMDPEQLAELVRQFSPEEDPSDDRQIGFV
jgi:phage RecT family recombinase